MALETAGVTREEMAAVLGVDPSTVSRWMHDAGKRQPRYPDMVTWANMCRVPVEWLAPRSADELPETPTVPSESGSSSAFADIPSRFTSRRSLRLVPTIDLDHGPGAP